MPSLARTRNMRSVVTPEAGQVPDQQRKQYEYAGDVYRKDQILQSIEII